MSKPIDTIWAAVSADRNGQDQIVLFHGYAVVAADPERLPMVRQIASALAFNGQSPVRLIKYTVSEEVERWEVDGRA